MNKLSANILFIADIIGTPGLKIIKKSLPIIKKKYLIDFCLANGENGAGGKGLSEEIANEYFRNGIDIITSGNHIFENYKIHRMLDQGDKILRPLNYPKGVIGKGSSIYRVFNDLNIGVINIQGRTFMYNIDCPFRIVIDEIDKMKRVTPIIIVDFHAEATAEKLAMAWYLDGKVSAVIGTHTHVQTNDEQILPKGTAYITDVGMTGPFDSVIGMKKEIAINRFLHQTPMRYQPADENLKFSGLLFSIDCRTGRSEKVMKLFLPANAEGKIENYEC